MLSGSEKFYDDIYGAMGKDYVAEADKLHQFIQKYKRTEGNMLLDVACGTGTHAGLLSKHYNVEGMDFNANMLKVARKKHPDLRFSRGDMREFDLGREFDIITCLFSAIGYMRTKTELQKAIQSMSRHLLPSGVLLVEPWFTPEQWNVGRVSTILVDKPDIKIVRMSHGGMKGKISLLDFHYLVGTSKGIKQIVEHHEFGLFSHAEYMKAFTRANLTVVHEPEGVDGRGLYIGIQSQS
ncbi:MAG TPA: class I SAM-dependent methyltransferase [Anaerolineales bacterium]|nr:class I SAM-dependent methyltransferase [Anaerolineales bacterium]